MRILLSNGTYGKCLSIYYTPDENTPKNTVELKDINIMDEVLEDRTIIKYIPIVPAPILSPSSTEERLSSAELSNQLLSFKVELLQDYIDTSGGN